MESHDDMDYENCMEESGLQFRRHGSTGYRRPAGISSSDIQVPTIARPPALRAKTTPSVVISEEDNQPVPNAPGRNRNDREHSNLTLLRSQSTGVFPLAAKENWPMTPSVIIRRHKSDKQIQTNFTKDVPDEILMLVFQWLPKRALTRGARVSKRWNRLCMDDTLWTRVDAGGKSLTDCQTHAIISRGAKFMRLAKATITPDVGWNQRQRMVMRKNGLESTLTMSKMTHLDLSLAIYNSSETIAMILKRCRHLVALSLEHGLLDDTVSSAIAKNPNLEILNLPLASGLTPSGSFNIFQRCQRLKEVNIAWTGLEEDHINGIVENIGPYMTKLNISGCRERCFSDYEMAVVVSRCPNMDELDISDCTLLTAKALEHIIIGLKKLRALHVSRCYGIEPTMLTLCSGLEILGMHGCVTDEGLKVLTNQHLKKVRVNEDSTCFSTIARPTVGIRRTSIWCHRVRHE